MDALRSHRRAFRFGWLVLTVLPALLAACGPSGPPPTPVPPPMTAVPTAVAATVAPTRRPFGATPGAAGKSTATPATLPTPSPAAALPTQPPAAPTIPVDPDAAVRAFAEALDRRSPFSQLDNRGMAPGGTEGLPPTALTPFVQLFPETLQAPAPSWLQEGVRVTYYGQSASIAQIAGEQSTGGAGFLQCDVVALDRQLAVVSMKLYLDLGDGTVMPSLVLPSWGIPGAGDYWLSPQALADAERVAGDELLVVRMPTTISGRRYNAVRFEYHPAAGDAEYVWMFDEETGLLLFYRHAIGTEADTHRQLTDMTLVQLRRLDLPWTAEAAPPWVTEGASLRYEGTYTPLVMGSPTTALPYTIEAEVKRADTRWTEYVVSDYLYGRLNGTVARVTGVAQVYDALWLPQEALDTLEDGQVLDRDPVTGAEITVSRGRDGSVTLTETGRVYRSVLTYDRAGTLRYFGQESQTGAAGAVIEVWLSE